MIQWGCLLIVVLWGPLTSRSFGQTVKFAVIADIHQGYLKDVNERLQVFLDQVKEEIDFIVQLGDFTLNPTPAKSGAFLDIWNSFKGAKYHVLAGGW